VGNNNPPAGLAVGTVWAYRAKLSDRLVEVEVLAVGESRPARVKIAHRDDSYEGKIEWVPGSRLKVPWQRVDEYRAEELRWATLRRSGGPQRGQSDAAYEVLDFYFSEEQIALYYNGGDGTSVIGDVQSVADQCGIPVEVLRHLDSFEENGELHVPWETTLLVVETTMRARGRELIRSARRELREARGDAEDAFRSGMFDRPWAYESLEVEMEKWEGRQRSSGLDFFEQWAGPEQSELADELERRHEQEQEAFRLLREVLPRLSRAKASIDTALVSRITTLLESRDSHEPHA
jgi:hypothetical protein